MSTNSSVHESVCHTSVWQDIAIAFSSFTVTPQACMLLHNSFLMTGRSFTAFVMTDQLAARRAAHVRGRAKAEAVHGMLNRWKADADAAV